MQFNLITTTYLLRDPDVISYYPALHITYMKSPHSRSIHNVKKKNVKFTVKKRQLWLPQFYRKKYGNNILGFTVLT